MTQANTCYKEQATHQTASGIDENYSEKATPMARMRPYPITLIALFQFLGAGLVLLVVMSTWLSPETHLASRKDIQTLIFIVTRHNLVPEILIPYIMPLVAAYLIATGWGLWQLQKWSRHILMGTSGLTVLLWLRAFLVREWAFGEQILQNPWARQTVYTIILLNALIFGCLTLYPDVAQAFKEEE